MSNNKNLNSSKSQDYIKIQKASYFGSMETVQNVYSVIAQREIVCNKVFGHLIYQN